MRCSRYMSGLNIPSLVFTVNEMYRFEVPDHIFLKLGLYFTYLIRTTGFKSFYLAAVNIFLELHVFLCSSDIALYIKCSPISHALHLSISSPCPLPSSLSSTTPL